jgi:hypothetical protein
MMTKEVAAMKESTVAAMKEMKERAAAVVMKERAAPILAAVMRSRLLMQWEQRQQQCTMQYGR